MPGDVLGADMSGCRAAHARLSITLEGLSPDDARRPSRLPGWTVGHVLSHLARNADSHVRMLAAAQRGEVADQYEGGRPGRAAAIEVGAGRSEADLVADVVASCRRLEAAWAATADEVWQRGRGRVASGEWPLGDLPFRRWREVEVHHGDLGLGFGWEDWSAAYVARDLERTVAVLAPRLPAGLRGPNAEAGRSLRLEATDTGAAWTVPEGGRDPVEVSAPGRRLLAWLLGREGGDGLPSLTGWEG